MSFNHLATDFKIHDKQRQKTKKREVLYVSLVDIKTNVCGIGMDFFSQWNFSYKIRSRLNGNNLTAVVCLK